MRKTTNCKTGPRFAIFTTRTTEINMKRQPSRSFGLIGNENYDFSLWSWLLTEYYLFNRPYKTNIFLPSFSCQSEKSIKRQNITCNEKNYTSNTIRRSTISTVVRMTMVTKLHEEECDNDRTRIRKMGPTTTIMGVTMSGKWDQQQVSWLWQCLGVVTHQVAVPGNLVCCTGQVKNLVSDTQEDWPLGCFTKTCFWWKKLAQPALQVFGGWFEGIQKDFWFW